MNTLLIASLPIAVALINRIRGGWIEGIKGASAYIAGALLAGLIFLITYNPILAGSFLVAYIAAESFGWGKWISQIPNWHDKSYTQAMYLKSAAYKRDDGKNNGVHLLANLVAKEDKDFRDYGWWALVFRGVLWWAPVLAVLVYFDAIHWGVATGGTVLLGFAFPLLYSLAFKMFGKDKFWGRGELMYGAVQGAVLAVGLFIGV